VRRATGIALEESDPGRQAHDLSARHRERPPGKPGGRFTVRGSGTIVPGDGQARRCAKQALQ